MSIRIRSARAYHLQAPLEHVVKTSFGAMTARHAVFLVVGDNSGRRGLGESWVNFPAWAAWERLAAFEEAIVPYMRGREITDVPSFVTQLFNALRGPALQSGTVGPLLQALCAVEMALWDLSAQAQNLPLNRLWFDQPAARVRVYASGLSAPLPWKAIDEHREMGITLFKLKLGFGDAEDRRSLAELRRYLGEGADIAVDVNRGWTLAQALEWMRILPDFDVQWVEEPLTVEEEGGLLELYEHRSLPISGAENALLAPGCEVEALAAAPLDILQPDMTKYCPVQSFLRLLPVARSRGKRVYPHFLGSAPGQALSLHLGSGCGPDAMVEMDVNPNPLRTALLRPACDIRNGMIEIPDRAGLGWEWSADDWPS